MSYAEEIKFEVSKLPQNEQLFYDTMIKKAADDPFSALKEIKTDIESGDIEPAYLRPAALARTAISALISGAPDKPDLADAEKADSVILERAAELEKAGRHSEALRMYEAIRVSNEKEAAQLESLDHAEAVRDAQAAVFKAEKLTAYHEDLERERESLIDHHQLTGRDGRGHRISRQDAEAIYEKDSRSRLEASLQRAHGLTPAQVSEHE